MAVDNNHFTMILLGNFFRRKVKVGKLWPLWLVILIITVFIITIVFVGLYNSREYSRLWVGPSLMYGAEGSDLSVLVIQQGGKYGYIDTEGNILIEPIYEDARPFFEGLAAVRLHSEYGYIDNNGQTVIPFQFADALDFHDGKAAVGTKWTPSGFLRYRTDCCIIDRSGNILKSVDFTPLKMYRLADYSEGWYIASSYSLMDHSGNFLYCGILVESSFHEGLARRLESDGGICFIDQTGKAVLMGYQNAGDFSNGLAPAMAADKWGYIDKTGVFVLPPAYDSASGFSEGLACVMVSDAVMQTWEIIDQSGKKVYDVEGEYLAMSAFSEEMCAAAVPIRGRPVGFRWGFISKDGKPAVDFIYSEVTPFYNGIAEVLLDGKIGYIDTTGRYIWKPE